MSYFYIMDFPVTKQRTRIDKDLKLKKKRLKHKTLKLIYDISASIMNYRKLIDT